MSKQYAIIVLAAGRSSRLGKPKQLVTYLGKTLINRTIKEAQSISIADTFVILGANAEMIFKQMLKANCYINLNWKEGMGNTMSFAMHSLQTKKYNGVIFTTSDQPFISDTILKALIEKNRRSKKGIVVSKYDQGQGIPTFFSRRYFNDLIKLKGDSGAKKIIKSNTNDVTFIDFKKGSFDIDTPNDLIKLQRLTLNPKYQTPF